MTDTFDPLPPNQDVFLTYKQAAARCGCSEDTLRRIPRQELPRYRVGKLRGLFWTDLVRYIRRFCRICGPES